MKRALVTGGAGYLGSELLRALRAGGCDTVGADVVAAEGVALADVSDAGAVEELFRSRGPFDAVFHAAAQLQLDRGKQDSFWKTNADSARVLAEACVRHGTRSLVFVSSNCVYGLVDASGIAEDAPLRPFEEYGRAKARAEELLASYAGKLNAVCLRAPTIVGEGRLGVLSLVFDFVREGGTIWLPGSGENRYQFVYTPDLVRACRLAAEKGASGVYNVGCESVPTLNELFEALIRAAGSRSRIRHAPAALCRPALRLLFRLGLSPLGPFQAAMITNSYAGDISRARRDLGWAPTKSNIEMLVEGYRYYCERYDELHKDGALTGHRRLGRAAIAGLLKLLP